VGIGDVGQELNGHYMKDTRMEEKGYLEGAHERVIDAHHGAGIVELATVVGGGEQRHELALGKELIAILHNLALEYGVKATNKEREETS
jgi:hypothetical protein